MTGFIYAFYLKKMSVVCYRASSKIVTTLILLFLPQFVLTTVLVVLMETTNPATRAMDSFPVAVVFYIIGLVQRVDETNLFCGTTLKEDVISTLLPVIQHIYYIEENFPYFLKLLQICYHQLSLFIMNINC